MTKPSNLNPKLLHRFGKGWLFNVTYSPDGNHIAVATSIGIELYNTSSFKRVELLSKHHDYVASVNFSSDGKLLVSGSDDKTIKIWDTTSAKEIKTLKGHSDDITSVRFSPDGKYVAS
jgi:WD40 repeat protein